MQTLKTYFLLTVFFLTLGFVGCRKEGSTETTSTQSQTSFMREIIIEKTFDKIFPEGVHDIIFDSVLDSVRQEIYEDAETLSAKLDDAQHIWSRAGMSAEQYYNAAITIVRDMELNKGQFLTFGNILMALGQPSSIKVNQYYMDIENNIDEDSERIEIQYETKKVKLWFSVHGFLKSIFYYKESPLENVWTGGGPLHWPQKYTYSEKLPVISGLFAKPQALEKLIKTAKNTFADYVSENDWLNFVEYRKGKIRSPSKKRSVKASVILLDGITKELAKVLFFKIDGTHTLYCDTWWKYADDKWKNISTDEAEVVLAAYTKSANIVE